MSNVARTSSSIRISMNVLLNINALPFQNALLKPRLPQQLCQQQHPKYHHLMAMIAKVEHVTVVHMEVCVTKENCAVQNFNFVQTEFFMKDALNANKD